MNKTGDNLWCESCKEEFWAGPDHRLMIDFPNTDRQEVYFCSGPCVQEWIILNDITLKWNK